MKIRTGFVSNSSSSSYVIAYNPRVFVYCEHCGRGHLDPLMMLRGSPRLKEYEPDGWSNATQIICHDAETRITSLQAKIDKLNAEIAELETKPANEMIEEYEGYSRKVWQIISQKHGSARQIQKEIDHINLYVKRGKELIWCIVAYDDPVGKELKELEEKGMIEYPKNWI